MRLLGMLLLLAAAEVILPGQLAGQDWDTPAARELVARATARRNLAEAPGGVQRWSAEARGILLFLTQVGDDQAAPRIVKADELAVEVYWEAPGRSKQTIRAWREQTFLPTDIRYHRDHLGIVANDFGPMIRIGDGDEVRDVPHPLSGAGTAHYQFAVVDSVTIASDRQEWQVHSVQVRPRDARTAAVVGTLYLDRESAALVRFQFSFTPSSYREGTLEDITVVLENALQAGGVWLPWRQEIEIRRGSPIVDLPVRGIIRGHWELGEHRLDSEATPRAGPVGLIGGLLAPGGEAVWGTSLEERIRPFARLDLEGLRRDIGRRLGTAITRMGPPIRPAFGGLSDLARFNRVEGVRLGLGGSLRPGVGGATVEPWVGIGLASHRTSARLGLAVPVAVHATVRLGVGREVVDVGQTPVISSLVNSILGQEFGLDHGDWAERDRMSLQWRHHRPGGAALELGVALVEWRAAPVVVDPVRGAFRPNPAFHRPSQLVLTADLEREIAAIGGRTLDWSIQGEAGPGSDHYLRLAGGLRWAPQPGEGGVSLTLAGGWGSQGLPSVRGFTLGGWGTLPGTEYRRFGGRRYGLARVEWLRMVDLPPVGLGSFGRVEYRLAMGPFLAIGSAGGAIVGTPWEPSGGLQPVLGVAIVGLFGLVRVEVGVAPGTGTLGISGDLVRPWWGLF